MAKVKLSKRVLGKVEGLLTGINPEVDFDTFHEIMGLVYVETYGSQYGLELLDHWYSKCSEYSGSESVAGLWDMYQEDGQRYFGMSQLMDYVEPEIVVVETVPSVSKRQKSKKHTS
jgi:hypothetical protein